MFFVNFLNIIHQFTALLFQFGCIWLHFWVLLIVFWIHFESLSTPFDARMAPARNLKTTNHQDDARMTRTKKKEVLTTAINLLLIG